MTEHTDLLALADAEDARSPCEAVSFDYLVCRLTFGHRGNHETEQGALVSWSKSEERTPPRGSALAAAVRQLVEENERLRTAPLTPAMLSAYTKLAKARPVLSGGYGDASREDHLEAAVIALLAEVERLKTERDDLAAYKKVAEGLAWKRKVEADALQQRLDAVAKEVRTYSEAFEGCKEPKWRMVGDRLRAIADRAEGK